MMTINQGNIYWVQFDETQESASSIPHPHVVVQDNLFNHSRIPTVVTVMLTSNLNRVNMPGNVLLDVGEGDLAKQSVVEVSKIFSIEKSQLGDYIGTLSQQRVQQILAGMRFLQTSFLPR
jgi:mRNA interferase MazF